MALTKEERIISAQKGNVKRYLNKINKEDFFNEKGLTEAQFEEKNDTDKRVLLKEYCKSKNIILSQGKDKKEKKEKDNSNNVDYISTTVDLTSKLLGLMTKLPQEVENENKTTKMIRKTLKILKIQTEIDKLKESILLKEKEISTINAEIESIESIE